MTTKNFKNQMAGGLAGLVQPTAPQADEPQQGALYTTQQKEKPIKSRKATSSVTKGLREGYTRATLICNIATLAKIREIAYQERENVMDVVEQALAELVEKYERKHGEVVPPPPKPAKRNRRTAGR